MAPQQALLLASTIYGHTNKGKLSGGTINNVNKTTVISITPLDAHDLASKERERLKEDRKVDMERILATGNCVNQIKNDMKLKPDPHLLMRWTPLYPHPLPFGYKRFEAERNLARVSVVDPPKRVLAAITAGDAWVVEELYLRGCPVGDLIGSGYAPVHAAAAKGQEDIIRVLINIGVDVNLPTNSGVTPLMCALAVGPPGAGCAKALQEAGGIVIEPNYVKKNKQLKLPNLVRQHRSMDDLARELGRSVPYYGQY